MTNLRTAGVRAKIQDGRLLNTSLTCYHYANLSVSQSCPDLVVKRKIKSAERFVSQASNLYDLMLEFILLCSIFTLESIYDHHKFGIYTVFTRM
jgi:hypothetical protein